MLTPTYTPPPLPPPADIETIPVLKALARAARALADLKGQARTIPNQGILIDTLALQEARASSEIENIVTTQDELFQADLFPEDPISPAAKEVALYRDALHLGHRRMIETGGLIPNSTLIELFRLLKGRNDGFRVTPGTALKNESTGQIVFVPPQDANEIVALMTDLERFVNDDAISDLDPLIKMALIHHQFESIHPFPDGNGRIATREENVTDLRVRLDVGQRLFPQAGRELVLAASLSDHARPSAVAAVRRTGAGHEKQHPIGITVHQTRNRGIVIFAERVVSFTGRADVLTAHRDVRAAYWIQRVVETHQACVVWRDAHWQPAPVEGQRGPLVFAQPDDAPKFFDRSDP